MSTLLQRQREELARIREQAEQADGVAEAAAKDATVVESERSALQLASRTLVSGVASPYVGNVHCHFRRHA